uniref:ENT domain-containing protein n=1 Tax=Musa acuminata subsp. malaccensis TaxID=214687 RepID=A0A804INJ2_MUSAM
MEYDPSDSSGTDDDLPPSHYNRGARGGRVYGNGRATFGAIPYSNAPNDMEVQIHWLEQDSYSSVLRAFKAQSDAITWVVIHIVFQIDIMLLLSIFQCLCAILLLRHEKVCLQEKESLITELRKELRVSDEEHGELLSNVNADGIIWRIRNNNTKSYCISILKEAEDISAIPFLTLGAPSPALQSQLAASMQPSLSASKRGAAAGTKGKKPKSPGASSAKSMHYPSAGLSGRGQIANENYSGAVVAGLHALVDDTDMYKETWEWINLKETSNILFRSLSVTVWLQICPENIRWEVEEDPDIVLQSGQVASRRGVKRTTAHGGGIPGAGRGRGSLKNQKKKDFLLSQNSIGKKSTGNIEILQTDTLIKEVEKLLGASHPDPLEIEKAQQMLEKHEQALIDAIANLDDAYDGERGNYCP